MIKIIFNLILKYFKRLYLVATFKKDLVGFSGYLEARVKRKGSDKKELLWSIPVKNLIVDVGLAQIALLLGDGAGAVFGWGAIGTGTNAPANGDTVLQTEVDRQAVSFSRITTTVTNDTGQYVSTHTAPVGGWAITEYACVNAAAAGVIANRLTFGAINLAESDQLEFTYKLQNQRV